MPNSQIEHLKYTIVEWISLEYFKNITEILCNNKIKNYIDLGANVGGVCDVILSLVNSFENIDFIKIDVEGSEYNILENSSLVKKSRFLEIEFHDSAIEETITKCLPNFKIIYKFNNNVFLEKYL